MTETMLNGTNFCTSMKNKMTVAASPQRVRDQPLVEMLPQDLVRAMAQLQRVYKMRDMYDNCYAEAVNIPRYPDHDIQVRSVKVQTNILELLGIDDL